MGFTRLPCSTHRHGVINLRSIRVYSLLEREALIGFQGGDGSVTLPGPR